jgi:predicted transcriptional regulator of viral defense system
MRDSVYLKKWLKKNATPTRYLFLSDDLKLLFPDIKPSNFKALMFRMVKQGVLERICRGLYAYIDAIPHDGLLLFHVVNFLRNNHFNYLSLETVLSQGGVISQIATDKINVMTSGRTYRQMVGKYGIIEFIHTDKKPINLIEDLDYDLNLKIWVASIKLAIEDMKNTHRNLDLIDWEIAHEFI